MLSKSEQKKKRLDTKTTNNTKMPIRKAENATDAILTRWVGRPQTRVTVNVPLTACVSLPNENEERCPSPPKESEEREVFVSV